MERRDAIFQAVDAFNAAHRDWQNDNLRPRVDAQYDSEVNKLVAVLNDGPVPLPCFGVVSAVQRFVAEWVDFVQIASDQNYSPRANSRQEEDVWSAREAIEKERKKRAVTEDEHESIELLVEQKVPTTQIAKMWGIEPHLVEGYLRRDANGNRHWDFPEGVDKWQRPDQIAKDRSATGDLGQLERGLEAVALRAEHEASIAPESLKDLILQGVDAAQICRMRPHDAEDVTIDQVMLAAKEMGITLPPPGDIASESVRRDEEIKQLQVAVPSVP